MTTSMFHTFAQNDCSFIEMHTVVQNIILPAEL